MNKVDLEKILDENSSDALYQGLLGKYGSEVQNELTEKYSAIVIDYKLHPDDDFEKIEEILYEQLKSDNKNEKNQKITF